MDAEQVGRAFHKLEKKGDTTDFQNWVQGRVTYENDRSIIRGKQSVLAALRRLKRVEVAGVQVSNMSETQRKQRHGTNTGFVVTVSVKDLSLPIVYDLWFTEKDQLFAIHVLSDLV